MEVHLTGNPSVHRGRAAHSVGASTHVTGATYMRLHALSSRSSYMSPFCVRQSAFPSQQHAAALQAVCLAWGAAWVAAPDTSKPLFSCRGAWSSCEAKYTTPCCIVVWQLSWVLLVFSSAIYTLPQRNIPHCYPESLSSMCVLNVVCAGRTGVLACLYPLPSCLSWWFAEYCEPAQQL